MVLQRPRDVFWKIKAVYQVPPCPEHKRAVIHGGARFEKEGGNSMIVLLQNRTAWEGLKTNNNNPRRPREGQEQKKSVLESFS